ncbi:hypothetical protein [Dyadobacter sp. CY356]|uniref:hypothetical protein n=1 Tax=Dyadobacter sp. CY356 TaxID=2906442 RepID=UPI001F1F3E64|nr:hypothetical protein [Dyadobacter sp. CY356]MCF0055496.1 hypothetical protein [Dyadobacter sp. CY356]
MNVEQAKLIPIQEVAEALGAVLYKDNVKEATYFSPFRNEKTASFRVRKAINKYKDFGDHRPQGDPIDLIIDFHDMKRNDPEATKFALKFLERFDSMPRITIYREAKEVTYSEVYKIKKLSDRINDRACVAELERRNLSKVTIQKYLKQADVEFNKKTFRAISFENDKGGHEISTYGQWGGKPFKNCVGPKAITTFPAHPVQTDVTAYVFNGKFDLATWDQMQGGQKPNEEFICSNGDSMIGEVGAYILSRKDVIKRVYAFPDHDASGAGEKAMHALGSILEDEDIQYGFMDEVYKDFEDLSAYFMRDKTPQNNSERTAQPQNTLKPKL